VAEESHGNAESEQRVCRPTDEAVTSQIETNRKLDLDIRRGTGIC